MQHNANEVIVHHILFSFWVCNTIDTESSIYDNSSVCMKKIIYRIWIYAGDIVGVYTNDRPVKNELSGHNVTGIISHITQHSISVAFDSHLDHLNFNVYDNHLKLVKFANDVTYRRLNDCIECLKDSSGLPRKLFGEEPLLPVSNEVGDTDYAGATFYNSNLNHCQREAVLFALSRRDVAIVHGPPGTGKTTTLIEIILQHVATGCKVCYF